jgi:hypothetical protein
LNELLQAWDCPVDDVLTVEDQLQFPLGPKGSCNNPWLKYISWKLEDRIGPVSQCHTVSTLV